MPVLKNGNLARSDSLQRYYASLERKLERTERERDQARFILRKLLKELEDVPFDGLMRQYTSAERIAREWPS